MITVLKIDNQLSMIIIEKVTVYAVKKQLSLFYSFFFLQKYATAIYTVIFRIMINNNWWSVYKWFRFEKYRKKSAEIFQLKEKEACVRIWGRRTRNVLNLPKFCFSCVKNEGCQWKIIEIRWGHDNCVCGCFFSSLFCYCCCCLWTCCHLFWISPINKWQWTASYVTFLVMCGAFLVIRLLQWKWKFRFLSSMQWIFEENHR